MKSPLLYLSAATFILILLVYAVGGLSLVEEGWNKTISTFIQAFPLVIAAFIFIGQLQMLLTADRIDRLLQKFSGIRGVMFSSIAGGLFPGPPYVYYPFVASFKERHIPFYLFFSFIVGKQVYDIARIPMEASLISPFTALIRNLITIPVPVIMGLISRYFWLEQSMDKFFQREEK